MRITVDPPAKQIKTLDAYVKSEGISRAAVVREAVSAYLPAKKKKKIDWRKYPAFGSEKMPKGFDSVEYVRKLRAEWDHRARMYNY